MVQTYSSTDTATVRDDNRFILFEGLDFHVVVNLLIADHALPMCLLILLNNCNDNYVRLIWFLN